VADCVITDNPEDEIHGGLWYITPENEKALDRYEGVGSRFYIKRKIKLKVDGKPEDCLFYQMAMDRGIDPPNEYYLNTIIQGYKDFGLPLEALDFAVRQAVEDKKLTPVLRTRRVRRGGPWPKAVDLEENDNG
jgi:hypothetical protein